MSTKRIDPQFDFFVPYVADMPLRDQRETMERPFFSLAKRKRLKPIEYTSPDGSVFVNVFPNEQFGMATIWDADILIWAASNLNSMRQKGKNDIPRTLQAHPYDLLKAIGRDTGGHEYRRLREGLGRLQSTSVVTNIRVKTGKKQRQFGWIESWSDLVDEDSGQSRGMTITLSDWFYEGILMDGGLLSIDPVYFAITGGRDRWLYRVARKHAGGAGQGGFAIGMETLFQKSGAEGTYRRFKFEMLQIIKRNSLPGFNLAIEAGRSEPILRMTRRDAAPPPASDKPAPGRKKAKANGGDDALPLFGQAQLTEQTIARVRKDFPGWDVYAMKADFDAWLFDGDRSPPDDYQAAFYGFARKFHERNRG